MTKRALYVGQRVHTRFWNEVTLRDFNRGPDNPFVRTATVLSIGNGQARLVFDPATDEERFPAGSKYAGSYEHTVPASNVHRGDPGDGPDPDLRWRERTWWNHGWNPQRKQRWDYQNSWVAREQDLTFRQYLRRLRDLQLRWHEPQVAQQRLRDAAKQRRKDKSAASFLAEQLRTPMTFPPGHPGCPEPIYPMLHEDGNRLGDGYWCTIHGEVTAQVMAYYYPPQKTGKRKAGAG